MGFEWRAELEVIYTDHSPAFSFSAYLLCRLFQSSTHNISREADALLLVMYVTVWRKIVLIHLSLQICIIRILKNSNSQILAGKYLNLFL